VNIDNSESKTDAEDEEISMDRPFQDSNSFPRVVEKNSDYECNNSEDIQEMDQKNNLYT
jgi:hypothetical protein